MFACFLRHQWRASVQLVFRDKFVICHLLLVKRIRNLAEHALFQFDGLLCHHVELHLLFARELVRSREWFLSGITAACASIANITTSTRLCFVFIFFGQNRLANLSLLLLAVGTCCVVLLRRGLFVFRLFFLQLHSLLDDCLHLCGRPGMNFGLYSCHLTEWFVVVHKLSTGFFIQTRLWERNNKEASDDFEDVFKGPFTLIPVSFQCVHTDFAWQRGNVRMEDFCQEEAFRWADREAAFKN